MLYAIAVIRHEDDHNNIESWWGTSSEPSAILYRTILKMNLPFLVSTQVRREYNSTSVKGACFGACFGASRLPRSATTPLRRLSFRTTLRGVHDKHVQDAIEMITSSISDAAPHFEFSSLQIKHGLRAAMHTDTANVGPSLFCELGPFFGRRPLGMWYVPLRRSQGT